jgi:hypothetical protein
MFISVCVSELTFHPVHTHPIYVVWLCTAWSKLNPKYTFTLLVHHDFAHHTHILLVQSFCC